MLSRVFIFTLCAYICFAANYDIIWDQNYCVDKDRYPDTYKLPHNSPCSLCTNDVITLRINSTSNIYENLYRVPTETAMMNCNATATSNTVNHAFDKKLEINIRSGGSEPALSFVVRAEPYYFISTSNGTQTSAENDVIRSPNSCLQFVFTVNFENNQNCVNYTANCNFSTVFTDPPSLLQCQPTTPTTSTSSSSTTIPPTVTQVNTQRLEIYLERFVPSPLSTVIPLCVLIVIIAILIIVLPSVFIPVLVLYARGIICSSKGSQDATQPSSRFKRGGSSLDALSKSPLDLENLYLPPFATQSEQAVTYLH